MPRAHAHRASSSAEHGARWDGADEALRARGLAQPLTRSVGGASRANERRTSRLRVATRRDRAELIGQVGCGLRVDRLGGLVYRERGLADPRAGAGRASVWYLGGAGPDR